MTLLSNKKWLSGSGNNITFDEVCINVLNHSTNNKIFIGSDSFCCESIESAASFQSRPFYASLQSARSLLLDCRFP